MCVCVCVYVYVLDCVRAFAHRCVCTSVSECAGVCMCSGECVHE